MEVEQQQLLLVRLRLGEEEESLGKHSSEYDDVEAKEEEAEKQELSSEENQQQEQK